MAVDRTAGRLSSLIRRKFTSRPLLHVLVVLGSDHSCRRDAAELARSSNARLTVVQSWHVSRFLWGLGAFGFVPVSLETLTRDAEEDSCARVKRLVASMDTGPVTFVAGRARRGSLLFGSRRPGTTTSSPPTADLAHSRRPPGGLTRGVKCERGPAVRRGFSRLHRLPT